MKIKYKTRIRFNEEASGYLRGLCGEVVGMSESLSDVYLILLDSTIPDAILERKSVVSALREDFDVINVEETLTT